MSVKSLNSQAKTCMDCASLVAYSLVFKMLLTKQCKYRHAVRQMFQMFQVLGACKF